MRLKSDPDQPALYAVFDLVIALSSNLAIAITSALTRGYTGYYLRQNLGSSADTEQVRDPRDWSNNKTLTRVKIIVKSLESLDFVRSLSLEKQDIIFGSFIAALQKGYGTQLKHYLCLEFVV